LGFQARTASKGCPEGNDFLGRHKILPRRQIDHQDHEESLNLAASGALSDNFAANSRWASQILALTAMPTLKPTPRE